MDVWRRYLRPGVLLGHVLVLAAALICLRLGWWQWNVSHEARGTVQNLGYALLWPVFAGSFIYMWLRFLHLEAVREADGIPDTVAELAPGAQDRQDDEQPDVLGSDVLEPDGAGSDVLGPDGLGLERDADPKPEPPAVANPGRPRRGHDTSRGFTIAVATVGGDDEEDDPELAAYNQALAALAEQDERGAR